MIFTTKHLEFKVDYDDHNLTYTVYDESGNVVKETKSKDALQKFLEQPEKKEKKKETKKIPVFRLYDDNWITGNATSVADSSYDKNKGYWVSWDKGGRGKERYDLYLNTESNLKIAQEIKSKYADIKAINDTIRRLQKTMEKISPEMLEA